MKYIYQNNDWPNFFWDKERIFQLLSEIKKSQGYLLGQMSQIGFSIKNQTLLQILTESIVKSSEIEGDLLNIDHVRSSVARRLGIDSEPNFPVNKNIDGAVDIMIDSIKNRNKIMTKERLFGWQAALFSTGYSGIYKIEIGQYRTDAHGIMQVIYGYIGAEKIHYEAPAAEYLEKEMANFLQYVNQNDNTDLLIKAAIVHLWFATLHPFEDGNGRIARALTEMFLAKSDDCDFRFYSLTSQIMKHRKEYYDILESTQKNSMDITSWICWFLKTLHLAIQASNLILSKVLKISEFWMKHTHIIFNLRQKKVLNKFLDNFNGKLTSTKWAKICNCSQDTASRDINDLLGKGVLEKIGHAKNTHYILKTQD